MVGPGTPGGDELRAVGEDQQHPGTGNAFQEILEDIFRGLIDPVEIFDGHDQGSYLGTLQDDPFQGLYGLVLLPFGRHGDLLDAAILDGKKLQEIGHGRAFFHGDGLEALSNLLSDHRVPVILPDVEVRLQDVGDGLVGHTPAKGEALAFQEGDIFIEDGLAELIEQARLTHTGLGDDGDCLAPAGTGTFKGVKQKLPFPLSVPRRASGPVRH